MNAHVFVVNSRTFKLHLEYLFAGTGNEDKRSPFLLTADAIIPSTTERNLVAMIADISRIRIGDKVIFYLVASGNNSGKFFGIFKAASIAFFDENDSNNYLKDRLDKGLSFRILIVPDEVYPNGITEHEYLDSLRGIEKPHQLNWSLIYRKLKGNRGCTMITDYEYEDLKNRLKIKNSGITVPGPKFSYDVDNSNIVSSTSENPYTGRKNSVSITDRLIFKFKKRHAFETHLQAHILQNLDSRPLRELLLLFPDCDYWIGNEVACGVGMQRIDLLLVQKDADKIHIKVIELKDEEPTDSIINDQLPWYLEWLSYYVIPNYLHENREIYVTPCIISKEIKDAKLIEKIEKMNLVQPTMDAKVLSTELITFSFDEKGIYFTKKM